MIFYNTELVDFDTMTPAAFRPRPRASTGTSSSSSPRRSSRAVPPPDLGTHVDPTLRGLAPFIYAAGGEVFDDAEAPTSLAFSDDATQSALEHGARGAPRPPAHAEREAARPGNRRMEWFKRGKLGMLPGFRDQVPSCGRTPA